MFKMATRITHLLRTNSVLKRDKKIVTSIWFLHKTDPNQLMQTSFIHSDESASKDLQPL